MPQAIKPIEPTPAPEILPVKNTIIEPRSKGVLFDPRSGMKTVIKEDIIPTIIEMRPLIAHLKDIPGMTYTAAMEISVITLHALRHDKVLPFLNAQDVAIKLKNHLRNKKEAYVVAISLHHIAMYFGFCWTKKIIIGVPPIVPSFAQPNPRYKEYNDFVMRTFYGPVCDKMVHYMRGLGVTVVEDGKKLYYPVTQAENIVEKFNRMVPSFSYENTDMHNFFVLSLILDVKDEIVWEEKSKKRHPPPTSEAPPYRVPFVMKDFDPDNFGTSPTSSTKSWADETEAEEAAAENGLALMPSADFTSFIEQLSRQVAANAPASETTISEISPIPFTEILDHVADQAKNVQSTEKEIEKLSEVVDDLSIEPFTLFAHPDVVTHDID
jgi:hypothetical protein